MNIQDWAAVVEIIGGTLVLVTLIFLAVQIRQNTNTIKSNIRLELAQMLRDTHLRLAQDPELGRVVDLAFNNPQQLTHDERMRWFWWLQSIMHGLEGYYHESRERTFAADWHERLESTIGGMMAFESIRTWWDADQNRFTRSFTDYVNQMKLQPPEQHWNWLDDSVYADKEESTV